MKNNIFKSIITTIFGILTMLITLFLVFTSTIDFIWSGVAGIAIGAVLVVSPDTLVNKLGDLINKFTNTKKDKE